MLVHATFYLVKLITNEQSIHNRIFVNIISIYILFTLNFYLNYIDKITLWSDLIHKLIRCISSRCDNIYALYFISYLIFYRQFTSTRTNPSKFWRSWRIVAPHNKKGLLATTWTNIIYS